MNLVFLDIDGVLNSVQSVHYNLRRGGQDDDFCPIAASNFRWLLEVVPDLRIVISSSWKDRKMDRLKELFLEFGLDWSRVLGTTPKVSGPRGLEIQHWLDLEATPGNFLAPLNSVDDFVILDDDEDMAHLSGHLFKTDGLHGLQLGTVFKIICRLTGKTYEQVDKEFPTFQLL